MHLSDRARCRRRPGAGFAHGTKEILGIGRRAARAPALDERGRDGILGCDKDGLPG